MFDSSSFYYKKKNSPVCYLDNEPRFQSFLSNNDAEHLHHHKHRSFKIIGAGGIIMDALQRILVVKGSVKWSLPKGHLKSGEKYHHCAMREIREETGLVVNLTANDRYIDIKKCLYYFIHYPGIGPDNLQTNDPDEISEIRWLNINEVRLLSCNRQLEYVTARWDYILTTFQKSKIQIGGAHPPPLTPSLQSLEDHPKLPQAPPSTKLPQAPPRPELPQAPPSTKLPQAPPSTNLPQAPPSTGGRERPPFHPFPAGVGESHPPLFPPSLQNKGELSLTPTALPLGERSLLLSPNVGNSL